MQNMCLGDFTLTLNQSYKWSPYIFEHVQKVKIALRLTKLFFYKTKAKALSRLQIMSFKMTGTTCTGELQVKVPSFKKVTILL